MKTKCKNCGDEFSMPSTAVAERTTLGYCTGCYTQWKKYRREDPHTGKVHWKEPRGLTERAPFGSRLPEKGE